MPRIRSLKYEYFINEDLATTSMEARLLGLGLTTLADREGRLEDRPARIKVMLFPYQEVNVDEALDELQTVGFLCRYLVEGKRYIQIVNFLKHQKPHPRESDSVIPSREKVSLRRTKDKPLHGKATPFQEKDTPSRVVNGLGDLCSLGNGSGSGEVPPALDFISSLKTNPAYSHVDFDREAGKMKAWLSLPANKGRKMTDRFVLNWLNKIERPVSLSGNGSNGALARFVPNDSPDVCTRCFNTGVETTQKGARPCNHE